MYLPQDAWRLVSQVLNLEDITEILGERPFKSEGMRNIDMFKHGFGAKAATVEDAEEVDEEVEESGPNGDGPKEKGNLDPAMAVTQFDPLSNHWR
jgi:hypothetical protein